MFHTPVCDLLGIEHPIVLAGMGGVSMAELVAAVSNAGGLGVIGAASLGADDLRREIRRTRELTSKPFAVDLLAPIPDMIRPQIQVVFEEKVRIFVAGLAVPREFIAEMHERGMIVAVMVGRVRHAEKAEAAGADIVCAQGTDAGGHTGEIGTLSLVPQVVDAVRIPVLAAGGIVDGRGLVAALALGAQGAVVGTRFICSHEAQATREYQQAILAAGDGDTVRTRCYTGKPARAIKNAYIDEMERDPSRIRPFPQQMLFSAGRQLLDYHGRGGAGTDPERTFMPAGQGSGAIHALAPAADIVRDILAEARRIVAQPAFADVD